MILQDDYSITKSGIFSEKEWVNDNFWTNVYDEAMEVRYGNYSFFAFFDFNITKSDHKGVNSFTNCSKTLTGWYSLLNGG